MYFRYVLASLAGQMQYKLSFVLMIIGEFAATSVEMGAIWALFARFGNLPDWNIAQVCLFYGLVNVAFAIADAVCTGFDKFGTLYVKTGNFDRLLLRPRNHPMRPLFGQILNQAFLLMCESVSQEIEHRG